MTRPFSVKGKRKRGDKKKHEVATAVEKVQSQPEPEAVEPTAKLPAPAVIEVLPRYAALLKKAAPVSFILDGARLQKGRVGKKWKILCGENDAESLLSQKKNLNDYSPVIIHEALRSILDSPTNKVGMLGAVYVRIHEGVTFEVKPHVRIPRTCDRFCGLMSELLDKSCIRSKDTNEVLIHVIDDPITNYLPANSRIVGLSHKAPKRVKISDYVSAAGDDVNLVFVVGAMEQGKINTEGLDDFISVSSISLEAKTCIGMVFNALERKWNIL